MTIKELGTNLDENYRNDLNNNFRELSGFTEAATSALNKANSAEQQSTSAKQNADSAKQLAQEAKATANSANSKSNSVQEQLNQIVIEGDSSVEAAQARVEKNGTVHQTLKEHTDAIHTRLDNMINVKDYMGYGEITLPSDFAPKLPFSIYRDRDGIVKHNYNLLQYEQYAKVLYIDSNSGNDSNNGDQSTPFKTLKKALQTASTLSEVEILIRIKGNQMRGQGGNDAANAAITTLTNKKISIIPDGNEKIVVSNAQSSDEPTTSKLTWIADGSAWKTSRSNSYNVFDLSNRDIFGVAKPLENVSSLSVCQSTPNSWYTDGSSVWVNTINGRQPDKNIIVCINIANFWVALVNSTIYMRDLEFYTGNIASTIGMYGACFIQGDYNSKVIGNKCSFAGGEASNTGGITALNNGIQVTNTKDVYFFNCVGGYVRRDVFNYHYTSINASIRRNCLAFEYNCIGYESGRYDTNGNNNAFTSHEGASVLRINPIGYRTSGPVCADVNGCYTIIIDGSMRDSLISANYDAASAYYFDNASATAPGKAILINCEGGSPKYSIYGDTNFDVQIRNFIGKNVKNDISLSYLK